MMAFMKHKMILVVKKKITSHQIARREMVKYNWIVADFIIQILFIHLCLVVGWVKMCTERASLKCPCCQTEIIIKIKLSIKKNLGVPQFHKHAHALAIMLSHHCIEKLSFECLTTTASLPMVEG